MRYIVIEFERGGSFKANLLEDKAPKTCKLIWDNLPRSGLGRHAMMSGCELFFSTTFPGERKPRENFRGILGAGDVGYWSDQWILQEDTTPEVGREALAVYYGWSLPRDFRGTEVISVFAQIVENLDELAKVGERMHMKGAETMTFRRP